jgi:tetratricopeptide (TPR) repeat protein
LEKDPDRRYRTAGAFAEDLRRYVNRFAIEARRASVTQRIMKWARRHPGPATAAVMSILALLLVGVFARQAQSADRRLVEERRRAVIQEAVLAARAGDPAAAEHAVDRAEALGASSGDIRLLRGQVALAQLRPREAIRHLDQAARLLPKSVAVQGLLASACWAASDITGVEAAIRQLDALAPQTAEDYLFKGQAQSHVGWDPELALSTLNEGIKRGDSVMARMIRADVRGQYSILMGDPSEMRRAREDVNIARAMKPDNPAVLRLSLELHQRAAALLRWSGLERGRQAEFTAAAEELRALESIQTAVVAVTKGLYWQEFGDEARALREWERHAITDDSGWILEHYCPVLYGRGEFAKALSVLEQSGNQDRLVHVHSFVLAEMPDGPRRAYEVVQAAQKEKFVGWEAAMRLVPLQFLGRGKEATAGFVELRQRFRCPWRNHWYEHLLDFETGKSTVAQLLALAGNSQWNLCEAHFYIALKHLADGDRAAAREHFRQCVATPVVTFVEHRWSRAFLRRMDADLSWPAWILHRATQPPEPPSNQ